MENQPDNDNNLGKKIFLLYPHSVIRDEMLDLLIMAGFETYTLNDAEKARKLLEKFQRSIMFINIDEGLSEPEWEDYIREVQANPKTASARLGIMSYNQDQSLMKKYLMELGIPCGYIQLKLGLKESTKIIITALEANEARGRRNSIRADCEDDNYATVNFKTNSGFYSGKILNISSAGIAAKFDRDASYPKKTLINGVQLKLHGGIVMATMMYVGERENQRNVQVLIFDDKLSAESKLAIFRYIKQHLQKYINGLKL